MIVVQSRSRVALWFSDARSTANILARRILADLSVDQTAISFETKARTQRRCARPQTAIESRAEQARRSALAVNWPMSLASGQRRMISTPRGHRDTQAIPICDSPPVVVSYAHQRVVVRPPRTRHTFHGFLGRQRGWDRYLHGIVGLSDTSRERAWQGIACACSSPGTIITYEYYLHSGTSFDPWSSKIIQMQRSDLIGSDLIRVHQHVTNKRHFHHFSPKRQLQHLVEVIFPPRMRSRSRIRFRVRIRAGRHRARHITKKPVERPGVADKGDGPDV
ncbi:hypothetical protein QBC37DRAFT_402045 [Rhypophila decipiens]|uniref:Uncharacterized protein n=1 Tax=Rhypophila decipiens TaxID=261697 RepID=A0AAN7B8F0_9PEZI|nr:hypothetical protein QBC37DRAFT_402045 [Rhypophila decipiens]